MHHRAALKKQNEDSTKVKNKVHEQKRESSSFQKKAHCQRERNARRRRAIIWQQA